MKLVKACIAMAAFAALFVVPSVASAIQLTHPTGTTAAVGTLIQGTNVAHSTTGINTVMRTPLGNIECATATLTGKIVKNAANGTHVVGTIETAEFRGTPKPEGAHENTGHCTAPGGFGTTTVTPNHTTNPVHPAGVGSLPWCITAGSKDEFSVYGEAEGSCTSGATRPLVFTLHTTLLGACTYSKASVTGTYTTHSAAAITTISGQEFTKVTGSGFCPATGKLDMAFTLETDTATPTDVYIDAS